jgi:hypothetical protein
MTDAEMTHNAELLRRYDALGTHWDQAEEVFADIERYIQPIGSAASRSVNAAQKWTTKEIWDSTAPIGAHRLASVFYSNLISTAFNWFGVGFSLPKLAITNPDAKVWIQDTSQRMFDEVNSSNFPIEMAVAFNDYVGPGSFCVTQQLVDEESWKGFEFQAKSIRDIRFEEDHLGRVRRYFVEYKWTAAKIIAKLGGKTLEEIKKNIPESVLEKDKTGDQTELPVLFAIYPRLDKLPMGLTEKVRAPLERPFGFKYILRQGNETLGEEGGMYEMAAYVGRYQRSSRSMLGFSPSHLALPTVKLLNGLQESEVLAAEKVVDPATLVTQRGLLSDLDLGKGGLTTVRSLEDIGPYESAARFDVSDSLIERMQYMIRKHYREDDISLKDSPAMTASEATLRVEQMNRLFGPQVAGLQVGVFGPLLQTTFNMMWRGNRLMALPQSVIDASPGLKITYHGPMMRSLRTDDVAAIERLASGVAALQKMGIQEAGDVFDGEQAVRAMADRLSTPGELMRSPEEVKQMRQQRMAMQQAAAQAEIAKTAAEADRAAAGAKAEGAQQA